MRPPLPLLPPQPPPPLLPLLPPQPPPPLLPLPACCCAAPPLVEAQHCRWLADTAAHTLLPCPLRSPTEEQAAAGSADGTIFLWDVARGAVARRLRDPKQQHPAVACAWSPLGLPLVSCDKAGGISFWVGGPPGGRRGSGGGGGGGGGGR